MDEKNSRKTERVNKVQVAQLFAELVTFFETKATSPNFESGMIRFTAGGREWKAWASFDQDGKAQLIVQER